MIFTTEKIYRIIPEIEELNKLHHEEVAPYDDIPLNVDWERYIMANINGSYICFTARKEGKLVGYAGFFFGKSLEYSDSLQAKMNNIFIHPDYRGKGARFITWCDTQLKEMGVQVVYHHVKAKNDYGKLLNRLGYDIMNIEYAKRLD